jgi:DNA-binding NtrC family response regulator
VSQPADSAIVRPAPGVLEGTETVLVVEDEDMVRRAVCRLLSNHGYTVLEARRGAEAVHLAGTARRRIDLMLTDVVLPEMGGLDLAVEMRKRHPETKVVYMSGYTGHALVHRCMVDEQTAFVQKPFTMETLLGTLRQVLDGAKATPPPS